MIPTLTMFDFQEKKVLQKSLADIETTIDLQVLMPLFYTIQYRLPASMAYYLNDPFITLTVFLTP